MCMQCIIIQPQLSHHGDLTNNTAVKVSAADLSYQVACDQIKYIVNQLTFLHAVQFKWDS